MKPAQGIATTAQRYLVSFLAGMSQTGGAASVTEIQTAYNLGVNGDPSIGIPAYGKEYMDALIDARAGNAIKTIMKCGLFENPYSDPDKADRENGSVELNEIAFNAHHQSIVMLKNSDNLLPVAKTKKVYAVGSYVQGTDGTGYGNIAHDFRGITQIAGRYYDVTTDPAEADVGIVMIGTPNNGNGTAGRAQTAQWGNYTKTVGRKVSLGGYWLKGASGNTQVMAWEIPDPAVDRKQNMSNIGFTTIPATATAYEGVLDTLKNAKAALGDKPLILIVNYKLGFVPAEIESLADAIIVGVQTAQEAFMNVIAGDYEPTGLLALTLPRSMNHIEMSHEDVPDTTPYVDADGNVYQFGFGLNYSGRIVDERTEQYIGLKAINRLEIGNDDTVKVPIELMTYKYGPAGLTAQVYYDKANMVLEGFEAAPGYMLVGSGDKFTFANASAITTNTVIGYAIFKIADLANFDVSKVTFAMESAYDADIIPTMARFNDALVSGKPFMAGDVTGDGIVDVRDAIRVLQYLAGNIQFNARQLNAADVNVDGDVNVADVIAIMRMSI
jgi:beta-glucosidase